MRYLGGKHRQAKLIAPVLYAHLLPEHQQYVEPFVGAACVMCKMDKLTIPRFGLDIHEDLILMWQALLDGWDPPQYVSEEEHRALSHAAPSALRGFVGFGCSWGGKWFNGYARRGTGLLGSHGPDREATNYAGFAARSCQRKVKHLRGVTFIQSDYRNIEFTKPSLIYCDPPYMGVTRHNEFDHAEYWDWVRALEEEGHAVICTEFTYPDDFEVLARMNPKFNIGSNEKRGTDQPEVMVRWRG